MTQKRKWTTREDGPGGTVRTEVYEGFDRRWNPPSEVEHVALLLVEGEIAVFAIEDPQKVSGFMKYIVESEMYEECTILGVYSRRR